MKKALLVVLILIVSTAIYFLMNRDITTVEKIETHDTNDKVKAPSLLNVSGPIIQKKILGTNKNENSISNQPRNHGTLSQADSDTPPLSEAEIKKLEKYFEKVENEWQAKIRNLFIKELGLSEDIARTYFEMRDSYDEGKANAFKEFHEDLEDKHGDSYSYKASEDQEDFEKKALKGYMKQLRKVLGDNEFKKYLLLKDQFNEKLRKEQDPSMGILLIEI